MSYTPYQPPVPQHAPPPRDPTAVIGRRILAYLIDIVISVVAFVVLFAAFGDSIDGVIIDDICAFEESPTLCFQSDDTVWYAEDGDAATIYLGTLAVGLANLVLLTAVTGASVGKFATGLRVVNAEGQRAEFWRVLVRWIFLFVDASCFLIGLITSLSTKGHRRVGDLVGGTFVIDAKAIGIAPVAPPYPPQQYGGPAQPWSQPPAPGQPQYGQAPDVTDWSRPGPPPQQQWGPPGQQPPTPPQQLQQQWGAPPPPPPPPPPPAQPQWGAPPPPPPAPTETAPPPAPPSGPPPGEDDSDDTSPGGGAPPA